MVAESPTASTIGYNDAAEVTPAVVPNLHSMGHRDESAGRFVQRTWGQVYKAVWQINGSRGGFPIALCRDLCVEVFG
jgi:hypothetical protein